MDLDGALLEHFGFGAFRPGRREACEAALCGRDVMVVMPTGSRKPLCYPLERTDAANGKFALEELAVVPS